MRTIIKTMFGELTPWGKFWLYLGLVSLAAAAGMSFAVGWKMTALHAMFLACLSFVTAFLPEAAYRAWNDGKRGVALALCIVAAPLFLIEFGQHAAYTAGVRGVDIVTAKVQNAKYDDNRDSVASAQTNLALARKRLDELQTANGWAASADATAMRALLKEKQDAADREAARVRCGPKCEALKAEVMALTEKISVLERRKSYEEQIAGTLKWLETAKVKAAGTEHATSQAEMMNSFLSETVALLGYGSLKPTDSIEKATQTSANFALALAGTGLPALALFIAGLYRRRSMIDDMDTFGPAETAKTWEPKPSVPSTQLVPKDNVTIVNLPEDSSLRDMLRSLSNLKNLQTRTA